MKIFYDTEFYQHSKGGVVQVELISIGMVNSKGDTYYAENAMFNWRRVNDGGWLAENVQPHLSGPTSLCHKDPDQIAQDILEFVGPAPEFYGWCSGFDHAVLMSIFGSFADQPEHFPFYTRDLKQTADECGRRNYPAQTSTEHNALSDAVWTKQVYAYLRKT